MGRLVGVELTRLRSRAATRVIAALLLLLVIGTAAGVYLQTSPPSTEELELARAQYEEQYTYWEENAERDHETCLEDEESERERFGGEVDFGCASILEAPRLEWFLPGNVTVFETMLRDTIVGQAGATGALMLLLGATFLAADFNSGAIGTWLTFAPRRGSVLGSKIFAIGLGAAALSAMSLVVGALAVWAAYRLRDLDTIISDPAGPDLLWMAVRAWGLTIAAGVVGVALAAVLRSTAAVIAAAAGYLLVVETTLASVFTGLQQWGLSVNLAGFVLGEYSIYRLECTQDSFGESCTSVPYPLDPDQFPFVIGVGLAIVLVVGFLAFRRRDVA